MIYYLSDLHFGHENAIHFDQRPFADVEEMAEQLIANWNARVGDGDTVWLLGDVCFRSRRSPVEYLRRMAGEKHLVTGNHDRPYLEDKTFLAQFASVSRLTETVDNHRRVVLCHFPLAEWNGYWRGAYHVYGHIHHGSRSPAYAYLQGKERALNAGCMCNNYAPATLDELIARKATAMKKQQKQGGDNHADI